jgi:adenylosuccinate lyase
MRRAFWNFAHNVIAHPLLSLTFGSRFANWLHDSTAERAFGTQASPTASTSGMGGANAEG